MNVAIGSKIYTNTTKYSVQTPSWWNELQFEDCHGSGRLLGSGYIYVRGTSQLMAQARDYIAVSCRGHNIIRVVQIASRASAYICHQRWNFLKIVRVVLSCSLSSIARSVRSFAHVHLHDRSTRIRRLMLYLGISIRSGQGEDRRVLSPVAVSSQLFVSGRRGPAAKHSTSGSSLARPEDRDAGTAN